MSYQHFRLGELAMASPLPPHLRGGTSSMVAPSTSVPNPPPPPPSASTSSNGKVPYGAGDSEDGYTLVFPSLEAFNAWRRHEEETQMVEFVKGDTHGSKAVPPRFKDHTKLVCARHTRSGRKKYVKKHPERVRKVPSRKLEGIGCPASISYKTYFDSDEVRASYNNQHSHEIGEANLPFTRRGRKMAALNERRSHNKSAEPPADPNPDGTTSAPTAIPTSASTSSFTTSRPPESASVPYNHPTNGFATFASSVPPNPYASAQPGMPVHPVNPAQIHALAQERWDRMTTLFHSAREAGRVHQHDQGNIAALEAILFRMFMEVPAPGQQLQPPPPPPQGMPLGASLQNVQNVQHSGPPAASDEEESDGAEEDIDMAHDQNVMSA